MEYSQVVVHCDDPQLCSKDCTKFKRKYLARKHTGFTQRKKCQCKSFECTKISTMKITCGCQQRGNVKRFINNEKPQRFLHLKVELESCRQKFKVNSVPLKMLVRNGQERKTHFNHKIELLFL